MKQKPQGARKNRSSHGSNPISGGIGKASRRGGDVDAGEGRGGEGTRGGSRRQGGKEKARGAQEMTATAEGPA